MASMHQSAYSAFTGRLHGRALTTGVRCVAATPTTFATPKPFPRVKKAVRMNPPYNVLITGSTKGMQLPPVACHAVDLSDLDVLLGVGRALAEEFLRKGDSVVISSRSEERVQAAVSELSAQYGEGRVKGISCDVKRAHDVRALANFARAELGSVDIWINNAGTNAYKFLPLTESSDDDLMEIVQTNVLGIMLCCREAVRVMKEQDNGGHIFNMDGAGADGDATPKFAAYGATKRCLSQLGKSLQAELAQAQIHSVGIHNLSPGMVHTELLMAGPHSSVTKLFINCLADTAEEVAAFLVPRVRRVPLDNVSPITGAIGPSYVMYLTKAKAFSQIFLRFLTGSRKDRFCKE